MTKAPLVLLINPWITDFAAHDLWTKPMGLLVLAALLREGGCGVGLIDCLDRRDSFTNAHPDILPGKDNKFGTGKYPRMRLPKPGPYSDFPRYFYRHGIHPESFRRKLLGIEKPDLIWITSIMTYWYPGVLEAVRMVREIYPGVPVWLGGIYARLCPGHAERQIGADRTVTGTISELPEMIFGRTGFRVRNAGAWGDFRLWPFPALDLLKPQPGYAPILTGTGCPYRCPFCASSRLQPRRARFGAERIYNEIARDHYDLGVTDFVFYDDALLLDAEYTLRPALERVAKAGLPIRFHVPNALHIRALSRDWCGLLRAAGFRTIRLGLETTVDDKSREWGGKVNTEMYLKAVEDLFEAGFSKDDIGVYLLCGLPGQTPEEVAEAIGIVRRSGVRPHIAEYSPIPGTAMWDEAAAISPFDIRTEPLYHNNTFFACRRPGFGYEDMVRLKNMARGQ
ncbi:MAG: B12-binding domain-containing radical SAM protein [Syntrophobacteraceae bacterium]|jgi:radical SAM superfamily enzyme YgiQ (UPF0313 family)